MAFFCFRFRNGHIRDGLIAVFYFFARFTVSVFDMVSVSCAFLRVFAAIYSYPVMVIKVRYQFLKKRYLRHGEAGILSFDLTFAFFTFMFVYIFSVPRLVQRIPPPPSRAWCT